MKELIVLVACSMLLGGTIGWISKSLTTKPVICPTSNIVLHRYG